MKCTSYSEIASKTSRSHTDKTRSPVSARHLPLLEESLPPSQNSAPATCTPSLTTLTSTQSSSTNAPEMLVIVIVETSDPCKSMVDCKRTDSVLAAPGKGTDCEIFEVLHLGGMTLNGLAPSVTPRKSILATVKALSSSKSTTGASTRMLKFAAGCSVARLVISRAMTTSVKAGMDEFVHSQNTKTLPSLTCSALPAVFMTPFRAQKETSACEVTEMSTNRYSAPSTVTTSAISFTTEERSPDTVNDMSGENARLATSVRRIWFSLDAIGVV